MINDNEITTTGEGTNVSSEKKPAETSEKSAPNRQRRRRKPAVKKAEGAEGKEQQEHSRQEKPEKQKPKKARRRSRPNQDVSSEDPTAAIRQRIFEIDDGDVSDDLPPILPILPDWSGSAPVRGSASTKPVKKAKPKVEEIAPAPAEPAKKAPSSRKGKDDAALRQAILDSLQEAGMPQTPDALLDKLAVPAMDFYAALDALEASGQVFTTRKQRIALPSQLGYLTGKIHITSKGFGFLTPTDGSADVFVAQRDLNTAIDGDLVVLRLTGSAGHSRDGEIVAVIERARNTLVGKFVLESGSPRFVPDDGKAGGPYPAINLRRNGAKDGQKVVCEMDYEQSPITARVTEVLGWPDEAGTDVLSIIRAHDIPEEFPKAVKNAARAVPGNFRGHSAQGGHGSTPSSPLTGGRQDFDAISLETEERQLPAGRAHRGRGALR